MSPTQRLSSGDFDDEHPGWTVDGEAPTTYRYTTIDRRRAARVVWTGEPFGGSETTATHPWLDSPPLTPLADCPHAGQGLRHFSGRADYGQVCDVCGPLDTGRCEACP